MIRIGSIDNKREFSAEESEEILIVFKKVTKLASEKSLRVVSAYGKIDKLDPEWSFLAKRVDDCIQDWANKIRRLGGQPRPLWTVSWIVEGEQAVWSLEPESYTMSIGNR